MEATPTRDERRNKNDRTIENPDAARKEPSRLGRGVGQVLSGSFLVRPEVRRHYPYVFLIALLMWLYIANIFHVQKLHRRHDRLTEDVRELRSRSLTMSAVRMESTRRSEILKDLELRGISLRESIEPPKTISK